MSEMPVPISADYKLISLWDRLELAIPLKVVRLYHDAGGCRLQGLVPGSTPDVYMCVKYNELIEGEPKIEQLVHLKQPFMVTGLQWLLKCEKFVVTAVHYGHYEYSVSAPASCFRHCVAQASLEKALVKRDCSGPLECRCRSLIHGHEVGCPLQRQL